MIKIYIIIAVLIFIYTWILSAKQDKEYTKNFIEYMKGDLEEYFEVRYIKKNYFFYILIAIPWVFICIHQFRNVTETIYKWVFLIFAILLLIIPIINFVYRLLQKIVYDHGRITLYLGNKVKTSGNIYDVDKKNTFVYQVGEGADKHMSLIRFNSGAKIIFIRENMDYGYKLEALIKKKNIGTDEYLEVLEELYKEDPNDKDLLEELEIARKGYDESELKE